MKILSNCYEQGGMLSVEEQIIDATTAEGEAAIKELEKERAQAATLAEKYSDDPE